MKTEHNSLRKQNDLHNFSDIDIYMRIFGNTIIITISDYLIISHFFTYNFDAHLHPVHSDNQKYNVIRLT